MSCSLTSSPQETRQPLSQSGHSAHRSFSLEAVRNPGAHTITGALYRDPALPSLRPRRRVRVSAGGAWGLREFKASPGDSQVEDHCPGGCASPAQSGRTDGLELADERQARQCAVWASGWGSNQIVAWDLDILRGKEGKTRALLEVVHVKEQLHVFACHEVYESVGRMLGSALLSLMLLTLRERQEEAAQEPRPRLSREADALPWMRTGTPGADASASNLAPASQIMRSRIGHMTLLSFCFSIFKMGLVIIYCRKWQNVHLGEGPRAVLEEWELCLCFFKARFDVVIINRPILTILKAYSPYNQIYY